MGAAFIIYNIYRVPYSGPVVRVGRKVACLIGSVFGKIFTVNSEYEDFEQRFAWSKFAYGSKKI